MFEPLSVNLFACLVEVEVSLLGLVDGLHGLADSLLSLECGNAAVLGKSSLLGCTEARSLAVVLSLVNRSRVELSQSADASCIVISNLLESVSCISNILAKVEETEVTGTSPVTTLSRTLVLQTDGQVTVGYLSNQSNFVAALQECICCTLAAPDAITVSLGGVSAVDQLVGNCASPSLILTLNCILADNGNEGSHIVSVSHSCVVVAQHLFVAISAEGCVELNLIVTVLHASKRLADVELRSFVAELGSRHLHVVASSCAVDVTVPAVCNLTEGIAFLILEGFLAGFYEGAVHNHRADVHALAIACCYSSNLQGLQEHSLCKDNAVGQSMLFNDILGCAVGIELGSFLVLVQVVHEDGLSLAVGQVVLLEVSLGSSNLILIVGVGSSALGDLLLEGFDGVVSTEESLHVHALVDGADSILILVEESLLSYYFIVELVSLGNVLVLDFLELTLCTEVNLVHLDRIAGEGLRYDNLIICIRFGCLGAEAEVRLLGINGMQTILAYVLLHVDENPAFSVLGSSTVAFEVSAVDVPCAPVTILVCTGVVTCGQSVEEGINRIGGTEDDVGVAVDVGLTAPLGSEDCGRIAFFVGAFSILGDTVDEVAVVAVAPLTYSVTAQQDVETLVSCVDDALDVFCLSIDAVIVKRKSLHDVLVGTTNVLDARTFVLGAVAFEPSAQALGVKVSALELVVNSQIVSILLGRSGNSILQLLQVVVSLHHVGRIGSILEGLILTLVLVDVADVSGLCFGIVVLELSYEVTTILVQVTLVVEGELVHLNEVAAGSLNDNLEVLIRFCATNGEVDIALVLVGSLQHVCADIALRIDENPLVGLFVLSLFVAVEVSSPNLPRLPVTVGIAVGVTTCYETIICRLDGFVALEDEAPGLVVCACAPLGVLAVAVDEGVTLLTVVKAVCINDGFVCSIDGIVHVLDVNQEVIADAVCLGLGFCTCELTVGLDVGKVTDRILIVGSLHFGLANPYVHVCCSGVIQVVVVDEVDSLIAGSDELSIVSSGSSNLTLQIINGCVQVAQCEGVVAVLDIIDGLCHIVEQSLLSEEVGIIVGTINDVIAIESESISVTEGELTHLHVTATGHDFVNLHLEVLVLCCVLLREVEDDSEHVLVGEDFLADVVLLVEHHPLFGVTSGLAIGNVGSGNTVNLPALPVTVVPAGVIVTCNELVVGRSNSARGLHDEVCTARGCAKVLGVKSITPLRADVAVEELVQTLTAAVVAVAGDDVVDNGLVSTGLSVSQVFQVLLEVTIGAETPFAHLQPDVAALNRLENLNPEILIGCCAVGIVELEVLTGCVSLRQSFAVALVDERPATCCGVVHVAANCFCIACEVTAVDVPLLPVTGRIAARVTTGDEEVPLRYDCFGSLHHDPSFCTVGVARVKGVAHLCARLGINQAGITFTAGTTGTRQCCELNVLSPRAL